MLVCRSDVRGVSVSGDGSAIATCSSEGIKVGYLCSEGSRHFFNFCWVGVIHFYIDLEWPHTLVLGHL